MGVQRRGVVVLATGPLALIQDRGRFGHRHEGVGHSGAADLGAHALGARLLGNDPDTAAIEATLGGLCVRAVGRLDIALTGAPAPASIDGRAVAHQARLCLDGGATLTLGVPPAGLRTYVSVRGGFDVPPVLGSRSTDTMSGLGPEPLSPGDRIPVGAACGPLPDTEHSPRGEHACAPATPQPIELGLLPGPRRDWFTDPDALTDGLWQVTDQVDRAGVRLQRADAGSETRALERAAAYVGRELRSEGMVRGAVQVPSDGNPVIFLADHPVTGGYPVIGVVARAAMDRVGQLRPGDIVRFRSRFTVAPRPA
ncbi:MAG: biotin-dependent carboxyltransferase family protein [Actinomycetia bacterium]|nr:biotin-dependent carboxyltransferase family protein [Actinomycetes bacterium]